MPSTINFRVDSLRGTYYDEKGEIDFFKVKELEQFYKTTGRKYTMTGLAKELGLHVAQVSRMLKADYTPFKSNARYFSDFKKDKSWFMGV